MGDEKKEIDKRLPMSQEQFLRRCAMIWDAIIVPNPDALQLLDKWIDFVVRFEGGQMGYVFDFLEDESRRLNRFSNNRVLANDPLGYKLVEIAAILNHPCQLCAESETAWWTRAAFCEHQR